MRVTESRWNCFDVIPNLSLSSQLVLSIPYTNETIGSGFVVKISIERSHGQFSSREDRVEIFMGKETLTPLCSVASASWFISWTKTSDIQQILVEAQSRWLRPAEICEILRNYTNFRTAPEPAHRPASGSIFLFDRKVLRYFRKDGHNWRKKRDGKTVKEAHERLKHGSIDVLHCYYAHGEENENFQRRSYWMLEEELSHIVLVHYLEVKGSRANFNRIRENEPEYNIPNSEMETSVSSNFHANSYQVPTHTMDTISMNSAQASEYEDAESSYNHQASSRLHSFLEVQQPAIEKTDACPSDPHAHASISSDYPGKLLTFSGLDFMPPAQVDKAKETDGAGLVYEPEKHVELPSWEDVLQNSGVESVPFQPPFSSQVDTAEGQHFTNFQEGWQMSKWAVDEKLPPDLAYDLTTRFHERESDKGDFIDVLLPHMKDNDFTVQNDLQIKVPNAEHSVTIEGKYIFSSAMKQHLLDGPLREGSLKKLDSFDRWATKELGDVNEPHVQSSSGAYWDTVEGENGADDSNIPSQANLDSYTLAPSVSQDQLFSIIDFSPNWVYVGLENKVLITGRFLKSREDVENCQWSCMFGEVEVPAEIIADGVLRCHTPFHEAGRVPFYVTCSNRVACSEVREFEYRLSNIRDLNMTESYNKNSLENIHMRFGNLLCLSSISPPDYDSIDLTEISQLSSKISSLLKEDSDEWDQMLKFSSGGAFFSEKAKEQLLQKLLKEKLHTWLLQKVAAGGKGPSVLDEGGQGVLHFAAALGYDWVLKPTIIASVSVNFRDVNGWTALHWAASFGREHTVASLIHLGAAPGALTDPTPKYPAGRTPADLASANGHKGIAGYLAESALRAQLDSLNLDKQKGNAAESSGAKVMQTGSECGTVQVTDGDLRYGLSLKDSLAAVCNATQTAARIHQVFRLQSFQKKQLKEYNDNKFGMSEERALSLIAVKTNKPGQYDEPVHAAAIRIQNKFRSWKGRKDFLIIRQQIVKIQAHVRGHQVRKNYRKIIWSVGILDKVILRWRRKRSGLRGFKSEALTDGPSKLDTSQKEDDDDFFREGRKQTEERSQVALSRVKSMLQYPEARDQYWRLRNVVTEIQKSKIECDVGSTSEFDDLIDLDALLANDTFTQQDS